MTDRVVHGHLVNIVANRALNRSCLHISSKGVSVNAALARDSVRAVLRLVAELP